MVAKNGDVDSDEEGSGGDPGAGGGSYVDRHFGCIVLCLHWDTFVMHEICRTQSVYI